MPPLTFPDSSSLSPLDDARLSRVEGSIPVSIAGLPIFSGSPVTTPIASAVLPSGQISPVAGVSNTGNAFQFVIQGQIGFVWSGSILTVYWDGTNGSIPFVVRRADGTQISIPKGSLSISALATSTRYAFAPFVSVAQPQRVSFVTGDSGSPRYAFSPSASTDTLAAAAQTQNLSSNEAISSGFIYYTTGTAASTTTGGGTSPSGGSPYRNQPPPKNQIAQDSPL